MRKLNEAELQAIMWEDDVGFEYELVHEGEWEDEGKFQSAEFVFLNLEDNKHYMFSATRSGNHWSGYEMDFWDTDVVEVEQKEIKIMQWVEVKNETIGDIENDH